MYFFFHELSVPLYIIFLLSCLFFLQGVLSLGKFTPCDMRWKHTIPQFAVPFHVAEHFYHIGMQICFFANECDFLVFADTTITLAIVVDRLSPQLAQLKVLHNVFSTGVAEVPPGTRNIVWASHLLNTLSKAILEYDSVGEASEQTVCEALSGLKCVTPSCPARGLVDSLSRSGSK